MKTVFEHIEHIKGKPHHVRKRVAFSVATGSTVVVALVWLVGSLSFGTFAIHSNSFANSTRPSPVITTDRNAGNSSLAGAAAVLPQSADVPAHIEIVDIASSTSGQKKAEQTIIPF